MMAKVISCLGAVSMLALAGCSHGDRPPNTPASDTMQSQVDDGRAAPKYSPGSRIYSDPPGAPPQRVP